MKRVVFLDAGTIGPGVTIRPPAFDHDWQSHQQTAPSETAERLSAATIAITNKVRIGAEEVAASPDLSLIAVAATGYDVIDLDACRARDVAVSNIRGYAVNTVPEHTFALITALRRNLVEYRDQVLGGAWLRANQFCFFNRPIWDLSGSTLGIIGAGAIGQAVGRVGRGFGMQVIYHDKYAAQAPETGPLVDLSDLRDRADVVTMHCPLTPETRNIIDADFIAGMKRTAILINTARGGLIDEPALDAAIRKGEIAGAGIDVTETEPPGLDSAIMDLAKLPNVILTPHVAWASVGAMQSLVDQLIDNIEAFVAGTPTNLVT